MMIVKRVIRSLVWRRISILFVLGLWSDLQLNYFPLVSYLTLQINKSKLTEYSWTRSQGRSWKLLCFPLTNMTDENICHRSWRFDCVPWYFDLSFIKPNISSASTEPIYVRVVSPPPSLTLSFFLPIKLIIMLLMITIQQQMKYVKLQNSTHANVSKIVSRMCWISREIIIANKSKNVQILICERLWSFADIPLIKIR